MQTLKSFLDQCLLIWKDSTAAARFGIILLSAICLGAIVGVGIWSYQPHYVMLANGLDSIKSGQVMAALDQANIKYEIRGAGSIINVDKTELGRAKVLTGSLGIGSREPNLEQASPWMDPMDREAIKVQNLERKLAATIGSIRQVESATVHLGIPERQPFLRANSEPSAAVMLKIASGERFSEANAESIAMLVAASVPKLRFDQVTISDNFGNTFHMDESMGQLSKQEEFRLHRENELANKAQSMLIDGLGVGNSRVSVSATFSFPDTKTTSRTVDPDGKVATKEEIDSKTTTGNNPFPVGEAGTATNVNNGNRSANNAVTTEKTETLNSDFDVSVTTKEETLRTPIRESMSLSVSINQTAVADENNVVSDELKTKIESMVKQAVGFQEGLDQFTLVVMPFTNPLEIEAAPSGGFPWDQVNSILKNVSLGIAALVALFLGLKALKTLKPVPVSGGPSAAVGSQASQINQLSEMVKQNPEVFSKIISAWANDADDGADKDGEIAAREAA